jgi:hypothetical protein
MLSVHRSNSISELKVRVRAMVSIADAYLDVMINCNMCVNCDHELICPAELWISALGVVSVPYGSSVPEETVRKI